MKIKLGITWPYYVSGIVYYILTLGDRGEKLFVLLQESLTFFNY